MIVDIVSLPRRLSQIKRCDEHIDSQQVASFPISNISRLFGYWEPDDTAFIGVGGIHPVITGNDAVFRYKFIEPTKNGIAEYFIITASPIDIGRPMFSKNVELICPWVTLMDNVTMKTRKFILWNGIYRLMHYETEDTILDVPTEAVILNELRNLARSHDRPDLLEWLSKYPDYKDVIISEERTSDTSDIEQLTMLGSNLRAYNEMASFDDPCHCCDIIDVVRGVDLSTMCLDRSVLQGCTFLNHVLYGPTTIKEVAHLFGMSYDVHAFQRNFNDKRLDKFVELSIYNDENPDLFEVLKNLERLSYAELGMVITNKGEYDVELYNPYDPSITLKTPTPEEDPTLHANMRKITGSLKHGFDNFEKAFISKSWGEEVYISITMTGDKRINYYFDMVSASLGSRNLIREYTGNMFC